MYTLFQCVSNVVSGVHLVLNIILFLFRKLVLHPRHLSLKECVYTSMLQSSYTSEGIELTSLNRMHFLYGETGVNSNLFCSSTSQVSSAVS